MTVASSTGLSGEAAVAPGERRPGEARTTDQGGATSAEAVARLELETSVLQDRLEYALSDDAVDRFRLQGPVREHPRELVDG